MRSIAAALAPQDHRADRLHKAPWGVFTHCLTGARTSAEDWNRQVDAFDVPGLVKQLEATGCRHYVLALGRNSGHFCSPNAACDQYAGVQPGKCSRRDLPQEIQAELEVYGAGAR
jgi:hypothetical protein